MGDEVSLLGASGGGPGAEAGADDGDPGDLEMSHVHNRKPSKPVSVMQAFVSSSMPSGVLADARTERKTMGESN